MARETNDNLVRVSYLMPRQLRDKVDADAYELGFSRNNMITHIVNQYYVVKQNQELIDKAAYMMQKGVVINENPGMYEATEEFRNAIQTVVGSEGES